jgi:hypothetical protein
MAGDPEEMKHFGELRHFIGALNQVDELNREGVTKEDLQILNYCHDANPEEENKEEQKDAIGEKVD